MLDAGESERRDELRRLAYGREAGLTEAQAAELRDLELRERALRGAAPDTGPDAPPQAVEDAAADLTPGTVSHRPQPEGDDMPPGADTADRTDAAPTASSGAATRPPGMRRWLVPAAAAAAILLLGAAIGWFGAARAAEAAPIMSVEQSELALDLEVDGEYDPGSVQLVGSEQNANLWRATRDDAEFDCVILTYRGDDSHQCLDPKVEDYGERCRRSCSTPRATPTCCSGRCSRPTSTDEPSACSVAKRSSAQTGSIGGPCTQETKWPRQKRWKETATQQRC